MISDIRFQFYKAIGPGIVHHLQLSIFRKLLITVLSNLLFVSEGDTDENGSKVCWIGFLSIFKLIFVQNYCSSFSIKVSIDSYLFANFLENFNFRYFFSFWSQDRPKRPKMKFLIAFLDFETFIKTATWIFSI